MKIPGKMIHSLAMHPAFGGTRMRPAISLLGEVFVVLEIGNGIFKVIDSLDCQFDTNAVDDGIK